MPRFNEIINNFINGEVSPKLYGRSESEIYKRACQKLENMIVFPQGGAGRRSGSIHITDKIFIQVPYEVDEPSYKEVPLNEKARLFPYVYSKTSSYVGVFHGEGSTTFAGAFIGMLDSAKGTFSIAQPPLPDPNGGESIAPTNPGGSYLDDEKLLSELHYAQNGKVIFFTHRDVPPFFLDQFGEGTFTITDYTRGGEPNQVLPFELLNTDNSKTLASSSAAVGDATLTSSVDFFDVDMEGTRILITNDGTNGIVQVGTVTSTTTATVKVIRALPGTTARFTWARAAWQRSFGYPRTVSFFEQRVAFASTKKAPEAVWFGQAGDIFEVSNERTQNPGATRVESDPSSFEVASEEANEICWLKNSGESLLVGTRGREYSLRNLNGTGLPTVDLRAQTSYGSEDVQPASVDDVPVFVQRGQQKMREMQYDYRVEGYTSSEITFLAEHMPRLSQEAFPNSPSEIKQIAYQTLNNNLIWVIDNNGFLFSCTRSRENTVTAFERHTLGGDLDGRPPFVQSICCVPNSLTKQDELWMLVRRTINGATKVCMEKLAHEFNGVTLHHGEDTIVEQPIFVDSASFIRPKEAALWVPFVEDAEPLVESIDANETTSGTVSYAGGYLHGLADSYVDFDISAGGEKGAIRLTQAGSFPLSSGTKDHVIVGLASSITSGELLLKWVHDSSSNQLQGSFVLDVKDSLGNTAISNKVLGPVSNPLRSFSEVELNYDFESGETRLFLRGKQVGDTVTTTLNMGGIDVLRVGANFSGDGTGVTMRELLFFTEPQHTEEYTPLKHQQTGTTLRRLDYLEGETVGVVAEGQYIGDFAISGGELELPASYETIILGLPYTNTLTIMPVDTGTGIGSAQGSIKRIDRAMVRFYKTAAAKIGRDEEHLEEIIFRTPSTPLNEPIRLVTDDKILDFDGDYDRKVGVTVQSSAPYPCNVTCISLRGVTADV